MEENVKAEIKSAFDEATSSVKAEVAELKSKIETLESKKIEVPNFITSNQYKGYNVSKQLEGIKAKGLLSEEKADFVAKAMIEMIEAGKQGRKIDLKGAANQVEGTDASGGYLVIEEYADMIETLARESSVMVPLCRNISVGSDSFVVNKNLYEAVITIDAEGTVTNTSGTLAQQTIPVKRLSGYVGVSNELLADARWDVSSWLTEQFTYALGQKLDQQILSGTGNVASNLNSGVLTAAVTNSVVLAGSNLSSITADDFSEAMAQLAQMDLNKATFVTGKMGAHYIRTLKDSNNAPIYQTVAGGSPNTIFGLPHVTCASISDNPSATASTAYAIMGNFDMVYFLNRLGSLELMVDPYSDSVSFNTRFIFSTRKGFGVVRGNALSRFLTSA